MTPREHQPVILLLAAIILIVAGSGVAVLAERTASTPVADEVLTTSRPATSLDTLVAPSTTREPAGVRLATRPDPLPSPTQVESSPAATTTTPRARPATPPARPATASGPVRIRAPRIGVDAPVIDLGLNPDGTLEVPSGARDAGWWTGGAMPGQIGPSVIVGHVDLHGGPAVFFRLRDLAAGDEVLVDLAAGVTVRYIVDYSASYPKDRFPTQLVYGHTEQPTLRLITCGGAFDRSVRSYEDNLIVFLDYAGVVGA